MLKVLGYVAGILVVVLLVIVAIASTKPSSYRVERSIDIAAPVAKVQPLVNDFHNWDQWSPWGKLDPNMVVTYSGAPSGVGAKYDWSGNSKVGQGHMEITEATPTETKVPVHFIKPFDGESVSTYTYTPTAMGTHVVWEMEGPSKFMTKIMMVFTSMDKMIGPDFERGLAQLKTAAER